MKLTLTDIKEQIEVLAQKIDAPSDLLPTMGAGVDEHPYIEEDRGQFFYVVKSRGQEVRRNWGFDLDDLLYMVFDSITFNMSCDFEVRHRIAGEDFRRQMFAKQEELLAMIKEDWKLRAQKDHKDILFRAPFSDDR